MRIKLDENLPHRLANLLRKFGHEVHTLGEEGLLGHADEEVWGAAQRDARFLVTQDLDFSDSRRFSAGSHHGVLLLRLRDPNRRALTERVEEIFQKENVESWARCFVVATERKIRVVRPAEGKSEVK